MDIMQNSIGKFEKLAYYPPRIASEGYFHYHWRCAPECGLSVPRRASPLFLSQDKKSYISYPSYNLLPLLQNNNK